MTDLHTVQHPPFIQDLLASQSDVTVPVVAHVLSCKELDAGNFACVLQGKFGYAVGTLVVEGLKDDDMVRITATDEGKNPTAVVLA